MSTRAIELHNVAEIAAAEEAADKHEPSIITPVIYRDGHDVRLLLRLSSAGIILLLLLAVSVALNIWMYWRRPDRIVVERTPGGDRVIVAGVAAVNNGVSIEPDRPGDGDKRTLVGKFAEGLYAIDPRTREKDIEGALRMMVPASAKALVELMKNKGELERQRAESWQAVWRPQMVVMDQRDPYRVNLVGVQEITKVIGGVKRQTARQLMFGVKLVADDQRRAERNLYTGFLVADILDYRELAGDGGDSLTPASALSSR